MLQILFDALAGAVNQRAADLVGRFSGFGGGFGKRIRHI